MTVASSAAARSVAAFANAGTLDLLGNQPYWETEAATLDTMLFLGADSGFKPAPLPLETQFSPTFGIATADFDGDGNLDAFLAQNFFAVYPETSRMDASRGLLLLGDGKGGFTASPGQRSGLLLHGEQRGCAVADFNRDGRPDLVVTQNAGPTKLYLNHVPDVARQAVK